MRHTRTLLILISLYLLICASLVALSLLSRQYKPIIDENLFINATLCIANMAQNESFNSMLTSVVQHTKTIAIEVVSGSQLNFIAAVIALFGLCFLFLYYLLTSELGYFNKTIDRKFEREMETTRNQLISEMRSLFQAGNRVDGTGDNLQPISTKSPIDISRKNTAYDGTLPNAVISVKYGKCSALVENLEGIGLSIKWLSPSSTNFPHLIFADQKFRLEQLLVHWSTDSSNGSLHKIEGKGYSAELNFLHKNTAFENLADALKHPTMTGALFISVFLEEAQVDNPFLKPLIDVLSHVKFARNEYTLHGFDASQLIPLQNKDFFLYTGSETNEPFREKVQWMICRTPISISTKQLNRFRTLRKNLLGDPDIALASYRPLQPMNNRSIRSSFIWT